jgi:hypothetical protein
VFIQIMQGKCTRQDELRMAADRWRTELGDSADGWLGGTYGFTDDDMFVGVIRFESREAAMRNSARPEQSAWFAEVEKLFDGPVEFHDCDRVLMMLDGGSDDAGFVQVMRGKIDDVDRLEAMLDSMTNMLHEARPEIIGSTLAIEKDGTFTETVAFTTEAAAREGEAKEMPLTDQIRDAMRAWDENTHVNAYMDLHHPWFATHR